MSILQRFAFLRRIDQTLLWGFAGTIVYYMIFLRPSLRDTTLGRYTTEHEVEYVIVAIFICGTVDVIFKLARLPREYLACHHEWLPPRVGREPLSRAMTLLESISKRPPWLQGSRMGQRLRDALSFVSERETAHEYEEQIRYLSDQDHQRSHTSYVLLRFAIAITPILGFLGTVVHFGTAIGEFSFTEMDEKLPTVIGGLGTAFNTTTVALAASMILMFSTFLCERFEDGVLTTIDRRVESGLLNRFETDDRHKTVDPLIASVRTVHEEAIREITLLIHQQLDLWKDSLNTVFEHFETRQQHELRNWEHCLHLLQKKHDALKQEQDDRLNQTLVLIEKQQSHQISELRATISNAMSIREDVSELTNALRNITSGERRLIKLEAKLADNLRLLKETGQLDGAMHGLTAAIHLLTARSQPLQNMDRAA